MSRGGLPVLWIWEISEFVRLRPTKMNEDVTLLKFKLLKLATFWLPRNIRNDPWKLIPENRTSVTWELCTTFLSRKLERTLLKRNAPRSRTATPPRLKRIRRTVKLGPDQRARRTSLFAICFTPISEVDIVYYQLQRTVQDKNSRSKVCFLASPAVWFSLSWRSLIALFQTSQTLPSLKEQLANGSIQHLLFEDESMIRAYLALQYNWLLKGQQRKIRTYRRHEGAKLFAAINYETGFVTHREDLSYYVTSMKKSGLPWRSARLIVVSVVLWGVFIASRGRIFVLWERIPSLNCSPSTCRNHVEANPHYAHMFMLSIYADQKIWLS